MTLGIRTDTATAQLVLLEPNSGHEQARLERELGRSMAKELLGCLEELLSQQAINWRAVTGIVVYQGPGSFTGLRIGVTVANTLAYALQVPVVGQVGETWLADGAQRLSAQKNDRIVAPEYGAEAHITSPRK